MHASIFSKLYLIYRGGCFLSVCRISTQWVKLFSSCRRFIFQPYCIYVYIFPHMGDFANYWQAFVPHPLRFGYRTSFFEGLITLYTHRIIEFSKTFIFNHFLLGLWISKKKCQDVTLCKKVSAFWKKYYFPDRSARKYSKSKTDFKNVFLRVFGHFDSQFHIFF